MENRFVKNDELASHLDETYWRNDKVDKRFEAHANQAEATAGDVELLGDHMSEVWEYTGIHSVQMLPPWSRSLSS